MGQSGMPVPRSPSPASATPDARRGTTLHAHVDRPGKRGPSRGGHSAAHPRPLPSEVGHCTRPPSAILRIRFKASQQAFLGACLQISFSSRPLPVRLSQPWQNPSWCDRRWCGRTLRTRVEGGPPPNHQAAAGEAQMRPQCQHPRQGNAATQGLQKVEVQQHATVLAHKRWGVQPSARARVVNGWATSLRTNGPEPNARRKFC